MMIVISKTSSKYGNSIVLKLRSSGEHSHQCTRCETSTSRALLSRSSREFRQRVRIETRNVPGLRPGVPCQKNYIAQKESSKRVVSIIAHLLARHFARFTPRRPENVIQRFLQLTGIFQSQSEFLDDPFVALDPLDDWID